MVRFLVIGWLVFHEINNLGGESLPKRRLQPMVNFSQLAALHSRQFQPVVYSEAGALTTIPKGFPLNLPTKIQKNS